MLHGIDISNWQKGLVLPESLDFAVMKATGGTGYVDECCDAWVQECKRKGILWGFYHFAGDGWTPNPEKEAVFFYENTKGYTYEGIPVLDIEDSRIGDWGEYVQRFVDKYHAITGVYPLIYTYAAAVQRFNGYPLVDTCGLWIAGYPDSDRRSLGEVPDFPYGIGAWKFAAIWQYTSNGRINGYSGSVDLDVAYMDSGAWKLYANPSGLQPDSTIEIPPATDAPEKDKNKWTFENSRIRVDVELK